MKNKYFKIVGFFIMILFGAVSLSLLTQKYSAHLSSQSRGVTDLAESQIIDYKTHIQPIFDKRCAVCHSCLTSPCQLNLSSYEGFLRGANKEDVYGQTRFHKDLPTRLGVDSNTLEGWRKLGFFPILNHENPNKIDPIFTAMLVMKKEDPNALPKLSALDSRACVRNTQEVDQYFKKDPNAGMPYGFPKLNDKENDLLTLWREQGASGPSWNELQEAKKPQGEELVQVRKWEDFFNGVSNLADLLGGEKAKSDKLKVQLVSRYLYEHLFLAHLYFTEKPTEFYSLVRSRTQCADGIEVISSRRPFNNPYKASEIDVAVLNKNENEKYPQFFYCLEKNTYTVMNKYHVPYELNDKKMERFKELFFKEKWTVKELPGYEKETASNPFITFKDIPVRSRYQFLLDDSSYHVNTFLKGPVCFGNAALDSIDEQFYVFFMNPESDLIVRNSKFYNESASHLIMPASYGSKKEVKIPFLYSELKKNRNQYRMLRIKEMERSFPKGYSEYDLWRGEGKNTNAILTIFRNQNSGMVLKGARGDLPKTTYILDYSLFERLVYNLVAGFDVYGDTTHQLLSRMYMDFIRMEAEENFLSFLPPEKREPLHKYWYRGGVFTQFRVQDKNKLLNLDIPTSVDYENPDRSYEELVERLLFKYMPPEARGVVDLINWKSFKTPDVTRSLYEEEVSEESKPILEKLKRIASVKSKVSPFPLFFPDISYLRIQSPSGQKRVFTIVHHKEHTNIAWIFGEKSRRDIFNDSISIFKGVYGGFPNYFFDVKDNGQDEAAENNLSQFILDVQNLKSVEDYKKLKLMYGVNRTDIDFWQFSDWINEKAQKLNPSDSGLADLSRYDEVGFEGQDFLNKSLEELAAKKDKR